jgi:hypothetical protein
MTGRALLAAAVLVIVCGAAVALAQPDLDAIPPTDAEELERWSGNGSVTVEPFEVEGPWRLTLGAWCFEGIGFVRAVVLDADGEEVDRVEVIGEGVASVVLDTEPGHYVLDVTVSHFHIYRWELVANVEELDPDDEGGMASGDRGAVMHPATGATSPPLPRAWVGQDDFRTERFEVSGPWEFMVGGWSDDATKDILVTAFRLGDDGLDWRAVEQILLRPGEVRHVLLEEAFGEYYLEVSSSGSTPYRWELVARTSQSPAP